MKSLGIKQELSSKSKRINLFHDWLAGKAPLPDYLTIGKDCLHHHGKNGKTVRLSRPATKTGKTGGCIKCIERNEKVQRLKRQKTPKMVATIREVSLHNQAMDAEALEAEAKLERQPIGVGE